VIQIELLQLTNQRIFADVEDSCFSKRPDAALFFTV